MVDSVGRSPRPLRNLLLVALVATGVALVVRQTSADARVAPTHAAVKPAAARTTKPSATKGAEHFTLTATGEILPHPSVVQHARVFGRATNVPYDFAGLFAPLAKVLQHADLAICHLEVPVAPPGTKLSGYPAFGIPKEIAVGIHDSGWDRCSTVSNHTNDRGTAGIRATLDAFDAAHLGHSGSARTADEAAAIPMVVVKGVHIAHLAYAWGFNGTAPSSPWMANVIDPARILADAHRAKAEGADVVVLSLHWGTEYDSKGSGEQRTLADRLLASPDVDLIIGHGPHVVQPIETYHQKYVLLSLGNLVANQGKKRPNTYDGAIATITFTRGADGRYTAGAPQVRPTWYDASTGRVRVVTTSLADPKLSSIRSSLRASLARTTRVMGRYIVAN
jgi:poly-gamma-glutamate capsule biosynthesis protein CapA/YwtB (metallophosphatase superfamily)